MKLVGQTLEMIDPGLQNAGPLGPPAPSDNGSRKFQ